MTVPDEGSGSTCQARSANPAGRRVAKRELALLPERVVSDDSSRLLRQGCDPVPPPEHVCELPGRERSYGGPVQKHLREKGLIQLSSVAGREAATLEHFDDPWHDHYDRENRNDDVQ